MILTDPVGEREVSKGQRGKGGRGEGRTRLDNLSGLNLDEKSALVEMGNLEGATGEGGEEVDLNLGEEVVSLALERLVRLLLNHNHDVSGLDTW